MFLLAFVFVPLLCVSVLLLVVAVCVLLLSAVFVFGCFRLCLCSVVFKRSVVFCCVRVRVFFFSLWQ